MFLAASDKVHNQKLKVQELVIRHADTHLYEVSGGDLLVHIGEAVSAVVLALKHADATGSVTKIAAASCSTQTDGAGNANADIKLTSVSITTSDVLRVCYITTN